MIPRTGTGAIINCIFVVYKIQAADEEEGHHVGPEVGEGPPQAAPPVKAPGHGCGKVIIAIIAMHIRGQNRNTNELKASLTSARVVARLWGPVLIPRRLLPGDVESTHTAEPMQGSR